MSGWVYVLELSPIGYVKVGQTTKLPDRLNAHLRSVGMAGTHVSRIFSVACGEPEVKEREILRRVAELPGVDVVNGREVFDGVTFLEVAAVADRVAGARYRRRARRPAAAPWTETQRLVAEIYRSEGVEWMPTRVILEHLASLGQVMTGQQLALEMSWARTRRPYDGAPQVAGYDRAVLAEAR